MEHRPRRIQSLIRILGSALLYILWQAFPASAQDAILPHGDPRLQSSEEERARQEEIRENRLKQQGQGPHYRIEGEPQHGRNQPTQGGSDSVVRENTGIEDPTVNPGQAEGMKSVRGRIIKSDHNTHTVRQPTGGDTTLVVDARTAGDTDLQPGDLITGVLTPEGRAVLVQKEGRSGQ